MSNQQPTINDVVNSLFGALEMGQKKGIYSFQESAAIFQNMSLMKQYFQQLAEQQKALAAQQKALAQQKVNKLETIEEI